jgi:hypothetical protein
MAANDSQQAATLGEILQGRLTVGLSFDPEREVVDIENSWREPDREAGGHVVEWYGRVHLSSSQMDGIVRTWIRLRGGSIPDEEAR